MNKDYVNNKWIKRNMINEKIITHSFIFATNTNCLWYNLGIMFLKLLMRKKHMCTFGQCVHLGSVYNRAVGDDNHYWGNRSPNSKTNSSLDLANPICRKYRNIVGLSHIKMLYRSVTMEVVIRKRMYCELKLHSWSTNNVGAVVF